MIFAENRSIRIHRRTGHLDASVQGECLILHGQEGTYFGLNETSTRIWQVISVPSTLDEIVGSLQQQYEVEPTVLEGDVIRIVGELIDCGLAELAGIQ